MFKLRHGVFPMEVPRSAQTPDASCPQVALESFQASVVSIEAHPHRSRMEDPPRLAWHWWASSLG